MTLLILGAYRGVALARRALRSIEHNLTGVTELVIVDDSGRPEVSEVLRDHGEVIEVGGLGYNAAMKAVTRRAGRDAFVFWEEDFTLTAKADLDRLHDILNTRPHLAQVALMRQPWFKVERQHGGLIQGLLARGERAELRDGVWETDVFTCNPALWRAGIALQGWPDGDWSEDAQARRLRLQGYEFGFLDGVRVHHDGHRSGHGY